MVQKIWTFITVWLVTFSLSFAGPDKDAAQFTLHKGFIIVNASVDGMDGIYILDSGAPGLVLNSTRLNEISASTVNVVGTGGMTTGQIVKDKQLNWGAIELSNLDALALDLTYLEKSLSTEIAGLIGFNLFEGYDVLIDYEARDIHFSRAKSDLLNHDEYLTLPVELHDHMMIVQVRHGGQTLRFGIDTGSRCNLISPDAVKSIDQDDCKVLHNVALIGADQKEISSKKILVSGLQSGGVPIEATSFVIQDFSGFTAENGIQIDGILGHAFFENSQVVIDRSRKFVRISKRSIEEMIASSD